MSQSPTPDTRWPILQPGAGRVDLLDHALQNPVGRPEKNNNVKGKAPQGNSADRALRKLRAGAMAILASLAGTLECRHCDTPIRWRWRPGRFGGWAHQAIPPEGPHMPYPADLSWQEVPA